MITFGLVTEGVTDQIVITKILFGFFNNKNIPIHHLQPIYDETEKARLDSHGGWGNLLDYLKSENFRQSFQSCDYQIIQIDTDICEDYGISKSENGKELSVDALIDKVESHLISVIGEFYNKVSERILFAISVHMIECWILPIFFNDKKKSKIAGCLNTLNRALIRKYNFTIDPNNKEYRIYDKITDTFKKTKKLKLIYPLNPSLNIFFNKLESKNIEMTS